MTKWTLAAVVALAAGCASPGGAPPPAAPPATADAGVRPGTASALEEAPIAAWVAAFEHLFEISGADGDREQPPIAYCIEIGTRAVATEVLAALNERIPHRAPQPCEFAGDYAKTPDGRPAWRFWISSIHRSPRFDDGWAVELNYMAGPLHGAGWRCNVKESAGHWRVTDCDRTFTS